MPLIKKVDVPQYFAARRAMKQAAMRSARQPDGAPVSKAAGDDVRDSQKIAKEDFGK
jgi:hypothetical protein